jgi:hypothetical protein
MHSNVQTSQYGYITHTHHESRTRGHSMNLIKSRCHLNIRKYFFTQRVVDSSNSLPSNCVIAPSVNNFENEIDTYIKTIGAVTSRNFPCPPAAMRLWVVRRRQVKQVNTLTTLRVLPVRREYRPIMPVGSEQAHPGTEHGGGLVGWGWGGWFGIPPYQTHVVVGGVRPASTLPTDPRPVAVSRCSTVTGIPSVHWYSINNIVPVHLRQLLRVLIRSLFPDLIAIKN